MTPGASGMTLPVSKGKRADMLAIREVLCATTIENPADSALRYSFFVAEQFQCALHVLHASDGALDQVRNRYLSSAQRTERLLSCRRLRKRLDELVRGLPKVGAARAMSHVADGSWAEALLAFSERQRADVIVLPSSTENAAGSVSSGLRVDQVAQRTPCPLLTVPATELDAAPQLKRILLALEPAATTGSLVEWTALWAHRFGAVVRLLYCEPCRSGAGATHPRWQREVEDKLRKLDVRVEDCLVGSGSDLAERVVAHASLAASDLIVMSTSLRDDTECRVLGAVRQRSAKPVLSVRLTPPDRLFVDPALKRELGAMAREARGQAIPGELWRHVARAS